jgi:hypothetical protein
MAKFYSELDVIFDVESEFEKNVELLKAVKNLL